MIHLTFAFYLLALIAGTVSLSQTFIIFERYRKIVIRRYGFFLLSSYLILLAFMAGLYAEVASLSGSRVVDNVVLIL